MDMATFNKALTAGMKPGKTRTARKKWGPWRGCKHRNTWLLLDYCKSDVILKWCQDCGSFRKMSTITGSLGPISAWCNPGMSFEEWKARTTTWKKRMETRREQA